MAGKIGEEPLVLYLERETAKLAQAFALVRAAGKRRRAEKEKREADLSAKAA